MSDFRKEKTYRSAPTSIGNKKEGSDGDGEMSRSEMPLDVNMTLILAWLTRSLVVVPQKHMLESGSRVTADR